MSGSEMGKTVTGFAAGAALFGAVDGYLVGDVVGAAAGALFGALIGGGLAVLAWRPRPQDGAESEGGHAHGANYMLIWGVLFIMTILEVGVAFLTFSKIAIIGLLLLLAIWKAGLVAMYYMHLKFEPRRLWLLAASPLPLALILITALYMEGW